MELIFQLQYFNIWNGKKWIIMKKYNTVLVQKWNEKKGLKWGGTTCFSSIDGMEKNRLQWEFTKQFHAMKEKWIGLYGMQAKWK